MVLSTYKPAKLCTGAKEWYVSYYFLNPFNSKFERFKERFDINRIKDPKKGFSTAKALWSSLTSGSGKDLTRTLL